MAGSVFTEDFKTDPYWWETSPLDPASDLSLPAKVPVAVIGAGYTGLHAALQIARGGREVIVLDAGQPGSGCSTRNGGQISTSIKPDFETLTRRHGTEAARRIVQEGQRSLSWIGEFIAEEGIDCDFKVCGRFHAAHNPAAFTAMKAAAENQPKGLEVPARVVPREEQQAELGTEAYHGGLVFERHASVDPGRYHRGLLDLAKAAGVTIAAPCRVERLTRDGGGFALETAQGRLLADRVVLATNGYSGDLSPWHQRRVIPIGSYVIATEPLAPGQMDRLMPADRIVSDSRKVVYYYRPSPDRRRILFGGRVSAGEVDPRRSAPLLRNALVRLFPELSEVRLSHSWMGFVAYTFDHLAHSGEQEGLFYAMGYCGSGVGMSSYLGMRCGQRVLGLAEGRTGFEAAPFQTRPLYRGRPWFLGASVRYYRWRDSLNL
ncbi:MAG: FAD-binding oxidoreductase [Rhodospirillales bacterium]